MKLNDIISNIQVTAIHGNNNPVITSVTFDSRMVCEGALFVAVKGTSTDGHDYIDSALEKGAAAIVCEKSGYANRVATIIETPDSKSALGLISSNYYGRPSEKMKVIGITGTNGKTTTVTLLYHLFTSLGYKCGLISTIENIIAGKKSEATHTTPDPVNLNKLMHEMALAGCEYCFMEVSSHALDQERVAGINFRGAIFSNITHDHLDYHKDFRSYINAKKRLFDNLPSSSFALTNSDDKNGEVMLQNCKARKYTYSCLAFADFNCKIVENTLDGMQLRIGNRDIWSRFIGQHNAYNLLAVYSTAILLGGSVEEVLTALSALQSVSGRLEYVKGGDNLTAVVDYAHTPDALGNVLKTLRDVASDTELITVFGCGGNRDKTKRAEMAKISAKYSDRIVVTSDNPRFEEPEAIIEDIKKGFEKKELLKAIFITDRREAIKSALSIARPGSIILVAGKGHENYQDVKGVKHHFDDKEEINSVFKLME